MHTISIHFGPNQLVWALVFKNKEPAEICEKALLAFMNTQHLTQQIADQRVLTLEDEFGQRVHIPSGEIRGVMMEDCDYSQEAAIVRSLHNARSQAKFQQRARSDATIKAVSMGGGMPSFDPMANGRVS